MCIAQRSAVRCLIMRYNNKVGVSVRPLPGRAVPVPTGCPLRVGTVLKHVEVQCKLLILTTQCAPMQLHVILRSAMRPTMLALVLSLLSGSHTLAQGYPPLGYPPLDQAPWWQLCGNKSSLPFDPHFSCCCRSSTGKYCVRHGSGGFLLNCMQICDVAPCR